ncbi:ArtA-dependent S-layer glycoprotein [Haloferax sp. YSSS75]|uniref:ArtA-dependent S-layer glycoprotein n=1 Tax=Haloferax sp. YSSS75 TaxID=3388564 RepID=UPI00398CBEF5
MTRNKQIRAVLLAALMVFSVFAGSIAFTGSAAAAVSNVSVTESTVEAGPSASVSVTLTDDGSGTDDYTVWLDDGDGVFESGEVNATFTSTSDSLVIGDVAAGDYNVSAYEGAPSTGTTAESNASLTVTSAAAPDFESAVHFTDGTPQVEVSFDEDVATVNELNVTAGDSNLTQSYTTTDGQVLAVLSNVETDDLEVTYNVTDASGNNVEATEDVTFAPVYVANNSNNTAYKGSKVAVDAGSLGIDVEVEGADEDNNYQFAGSTGDNSQIFVFDTEGRTLDTYEFTIGGAQDAEVEVRDLGLEVAVDDTNITTDDDFEGTVSANAGSRSIDVVALDSDGDEVDDATDSFDLNGQGEADFNVGALDAGDYTVEVTDTFSGVTVESDTVTVEKAADSSSDFSSSVITEQVGDIAEITVTMQGTDEAEVMIGGDNVGYTANVTVEDGNDDGEVVLLFNTYDVDSMSNTFDVDDSDDDVTVDDIDTGVTQTLDAGDYDLEVATGGDADNVGTLVLEERSTDSQAVWTAPTGDDADLTEASDVYDAIENSNLTQTDSVANGDVVVHQVVATGLEGAYEMDSLDTETNLTIEQTNPGPNREAKVLNDSAATVIADGENDTYFFVYDLDNVDATRTEFYDEGASTKYDVEDDDAFNATFTVLEGNLSDVEDGEEVSAEYEVVAPELSLDADPINVTASADQSVSGSATVAPGTELTIRVKSTGDTQPRFLKTGSAYVQADGSYSTAFDFSEQKSGDEFTVTVSVDAGSADDVSADGNVGDVQTETTTEETTTEETTTEETTTEETTTEETTTEETTTEETEEPAETTTESSTPGFGIAVALVALVAAALLAVRRD